MSDTHADRKDPTTALIESIRVVRERYDQLGRGKTAALRRCRTADEVAIEGAFWRVGDQLAREQRHLAHVVLLFPFASHARRDGFSFGRYLHREIGDRDSTTLRLRRLLDSRDRDELDHRLRALLKLASADRAPVDWGVLGKDILWFFAESDAVRRRWTQDFYAPLASEQGADTTASPIDTSSNL